MVAINIKLNTQSTYLTTSSCDFSQCNCAWPLSPAL